MFPFSLQDGEDEVDWGEDISEAAVQKRLDEISGAARSMTLSDDLEKTPAERVNIFFEYVKVGEISGIAWRILFHRLHFFNVMFFLY